MPRPSTPQPARDLVKVLRARFRAESIPLTTVAAEAGIAQSTCHALLRAPGRTTHAGLKGLTLLVRTLGGELVISARPTTVDALRAQVMKRFLRSGHTRRALYSPDGGLGAPRSAVILWLSETASRRASVDALLALAARYGMGLRIV